MSKRIREWSGTDGHGMWALEIETDKFDEGEPFVVTLDATYDEGVEGESRRIHNALIIATPDEARQMATALLLEAEDAEANTARVASYSSTQQNNPSSRGEV